MQANMDYSRQERLVRVARDALWKGIEAVQVGKPLAVIGRAIK
jgi:methionine aminopeptidase